MSDRKRNIKKNAIKYSMNLKSMNSWKQFYIISYTEIYVSIRNLYPQ